MDSHDFPTEDEPILKHTPKAVLEGMAGKHSALIRTMDIRWDQRTSLLENCHTK